jgi:hypothetical protein
LEDVHEHPRAEHLRAVARPAVRHGEHDVEHLERVDDGQREHDDVRGREARHRDVPELLPTIGPVGAS